MQQNPAPASEHHIHLCRAPDKFSPNGTQFLCLSAHMMRNRLQGMLIMQEQVAVQVTCQVLQKHLSRQRWSHVCMLQANQGSNLQQKAPPAGGNIFSNFLQAPSPPPPAVRTAACFPHLCLSFTLSEEPATGYDGNTHPRLGHS